MMSIASICEESILLIYVLLIVLLSLLTLILSLFVALVGRALGKRFTARQYYSTTHPGPSWHEWGSRLGSPHPPKISTAIKFTRSQQPASSFSAHVEEDARPECFNRQVRTFRPGDTAVSFPAPWDIFKGEGYCKNPIKMADSTLQVRTGLGPEAGCCCSCPETKARKFAR